MENKPNLVLTAKDLLEGANNPDRDFSAKLKTDLITVLEYMIENKNSMKIDLRYFQHTFTGGIKSHNDCGTYRCVAGWWAHWLNIPVRYKNGSLTKRFRQTLDNINIWRGFKSIYISSYSNYHNRTFFGDGSNDSLPVRLGLAKILEIA